MADWWEDAPLAETPPAPADWWADAPVAEPKKGYSGSILPFSKDENGIVQFDSDAGIIGSIKRAVTLPGDVYAGRVDPNSQEAIERAAELAAVASPLNPAARIGDRAIPGALKAYRDPAAPSVEELRAASGAGYDAARNMGVQYSSAAVKEMAEQAQRALEADGIRDVVAPKSFAILRELQNPPAGSFADISGIESARRAFGHAGKDFANPTDQLAAGRVRSDLDAFLENPPAQGVVAGPAAEAGRLQAEARANYAAAKRSEGIGDISYGADLRASAANSGQNLDNSIRSRVASLLTNPKQGAGFSEAEREALEGVARGNSGRNTIRFIGNLLGGGGGLGAATTSAMGAMGGAATGSPLAAAAGATLPFVGFGAKQIANKLTDRELALVAELTRKRSPLYEEILGSTSPQVVSPEQRAALIRALMLGEQGASAQ